MFIAKCSKCGKKNDLIFESMISHYIQGGKVMCDKCHNAFSLSDVEEKENLKEIINIVKKKMNKTNQIIEEIEIENKCTIREEFGEYVINIEINKKG